MKVSHDSPLARTVGAASAESAASNKGSRIGRLATATVASPQERGARRGAEEGSLWDLTPETRNGSASV